MAQNSPPSPAALALEAEFWGTDKHDDPAQTPAGGRSQHPVARRISTALTLTFMVIALVIAWPQSLGGPFKMVVVSGVSMEPRYHTGDLVLAMKHPAYQVGDIIVYSVHIDGKAAGNIVHRIKAVNADGTFVTQGDNKQYPDPWDVEGDWIFGRVIVMVPKAYYVLAIWRHPIFLAVMCGLFLTMALWPDDPLAQPPRGPAVPLPPPDPRAARRSRMGAGARL